MGSPIVHGVTLTLIPPPPPRVAVLVVLWALLVFMVYKVATADHEYQEYDPFEILQLDPVSL